jgi:hypothetical protein
VAEKSCSELDVKSVAGLEGDDMGDGEAFIRTLIFSRKIKFL